VGAFKTVTLIYPRYKWFEANGLAEPLGIMTLVALLKQNGYDVRFHDLTFRDDLSCLDKDVSESDLVGMTVSSPLFGKAKTVMDYITKVNPDATFIAGGPHATFWPHEVLDSGFQYAFQGEAELSFQAFLEAGDEKERKATRGLAYKENGKMVVNERMPFIQDLDTVPFPDRSIIEYEKYIDGRDGWRFEVAMLATRGCNAKCIYCAPSLPLLFGTARSRGPRHVVDELEYVLDAVGRKRRVYFKDDTFTEPGIEWISEFHDLIKERKIKFHWHCNTRADGVTYEMLKLMRDVGCECISFGVESGSPRILKFYRKEVDITVVERAFSWCHKAGIEPTSNVMLGAPMETLEDLEMTYQLIRRIKPDDLTVYYCTAMPGKDIYDWAVENHLLKNEIAYEEFDTALNREVGNVNMHLQHLTIDEINEYKRKIEAYRSRRKLTSPRNVAKWLAELMRSPGEALKKARFVLQKLPVMQTHHHY